MFKRMLTGLKRPKVLALLALFFLLSAPVGYRLWQIYSIPDIGEPFDVEAYLQSIDVPPDENAYVLYREAGSKLVPFSSLRLTGQPAREARGSLSRAVQEGWELANDDIREWLRQNDPALKAWREGTERSLALGIHPARMTIGTSAAGIRGPRDLGRLALLKSARLSAQGRTDQAWQWQLAAYRSVRHLRMNATIIGQLVADAIYTLAWTRTLDWAADENVAADDLWQALDELDRLHGQMPPSSVALKNEYLVVGRSISRLPGRTSASRVFFGMTGEADIFKKVTALMWANWLSQIDRPPQERPPKAPGELGLFQVGPETVDSPNLHPPERIERWADRGLISPTMLRLLTPAVGQFEQAEIRREARQTTLVAALALQLYHRRHGQFPESLDALANDILDEIPADPYGRGEPIRYRRDPESPQRAILWTIGFDRTDQQAETRVPWGKEEGDWVVEVVGPSADK